MKKYRKIGFLCFIVICIIMLFGCARLRIIDKISIIHVFGFDQTEAGEIMGTALSPEFTKSKGNDEIQYLEEQAPTSSLLISNMSSYTSTPLEIAKIRVLIFGKSYAEAGIKEMVDRLMMTPQQGTHAQIAISTHSARETMNIFKKEKSLTLAERLQHNMEKQLPRVNLHVFLNHFYGEGMDAYAPVLTTSGKNRVKIDGLAVFKDEKLKLHLNPDQTVLFSLIKDKRNQGTYKINLDDRDDQEELIIVRGFRSKRNWEWDAKKEQLNLRLRLEMVLTQNPSRFNIEKSEDIMELKKMIVEHLKKDMEDLFSILKENSVDPLGLGNIVRTRDLNWKEESFYEKYPSLPINLDIDLQIIHTGLESS